MFAYMTAACKCRVPSAECRAPSAECRAPLAPGGSLFSPVFEGVGDGLVERDFRFPPEHRAKAGGTALEDGHVIGAKPLGIDFDADGHTREVDQFLEQIADAPGAPRAHVVRAPGLSAFDDADVGGSDVTDVSEIASRVEV